MNRNCPGGANGEGIGDGKGVVEGEDMMGEGDGEIRSIVLVLVDNVDVSESVETDTASFAPGGSWGSIDSIVSSGEGVDGGDDGPATMVRADGGPSFGEYEGVAGRDCSGDGIPDDGDLMPTADEDAR